jgi:hypothetical protein
MQPFAVTVFNTAVCGPGVGMFFVNEGVLLETNTPSYHQVHDTILCGYWQGAIGAHGGKAYGWQGMCEHGITLLRVNVTSRGAQPFWMYDTAGYQSFTNISYRLIVSEQPAVVDTIRRAVSIPGPL